MNQSIKNLQLIICSLVLLSCSSFEEKCQYEVPQFDLNVPYEKEIDFGACGDDINYYRLDIEGEVYGDIIIKNIYRFSPQGKLDTLIRGEYYSNKFYFKYTPIGPVEGELKFRITLM